MKDLIWYEKHRATSLSQLSLPATYKKAFKKYIKDKQIPHIMFHGPAGSGKTTIAMILIRECASASLVLNASSSDRGINVIKTKVKQFASSQRSSANKLNIVLLDEADGLTSDAQMALKNTIETYHKNCRFIFTANEFDKIIEPIYSRCMLYKFDSLKFKRLLKIMKNILDDEDIEYNEDTLRIIIKRYSPDVRTIMNNLQAASISGTLKISDVLSSFDVDKMYKLIKKGAIGEIREMFAGLTDYVWFYKSLFDNDFLGQLKDNDLRAQVAITIAEYLWRDKTIADREINASACCLEIMDTLEKEVIF
jgi:replication factor C small subunit